MTSDVEPRPPLPIIWIRLMKLRVIVLLQVTAICAVLVHDLLDRKGVIDGGGRTWLDTLETSFWVVLGGTLSAGGSNSINMWFDHDIDAGMRRTNTRPVPMGWISRVHALVFGIIIAILGTIVLWQVHWKAGFWTGFSVLFYVLIYTIWLKRRSPYNIVIGGIAGATPPLIAWAAAASTTLSGSNPFDLGSPVPWMLFLLIFLWTPPHFWALALYRHGEYGKVGVPMMPDAKGPHRTLLESKIYCVLLILLAAIPIIWSDYGIGWPLSVVVAGLGIWYASTVWAIDADEVLDENQRMPKAFHSFMASLKYLALMFFGVVIVAAQPWL
jgi:protoheme IX farnesyltransferase